MIGARHLGPCRTRATGHNLDRRAAALLRCLDAIEAKAERDRIIRERCKTELQVDVARDLGLSTSTIGAIVRRGLVNAG